MYGGWLVNLVVHENTPIVLKNTLWDKKKLIQQENSHIYRKLFPHKRQLGEV